jgi:hypothetical protein
MKIVVTTDKPLRTLKYNVLPRNVPIEIDDRLAMFYITRGEAIRYETKEAIDRPSKAVGEEPPLSALPAGQALPQTTANELESGGKKRGRKKKEV